MYSDKKIKILFIYQDLDSGGAEEVLSSTVRNINKHKYDVNICCLGSKGIIGEELEYSGYAVRALNRHYGITSIFTTFILYKLIRQIKPDIVHTSLFYANYHGRIAANFAGVRVIVSEEQNIYKWKNKNPIFILIDKILSYVTDRIIACSCSVKDFTAKQEGIDPNKFIVIHNVFDMAKFNIDSDEKDIRREMGFDKEVKVIGTIGRLCEQKGHKYLIAAMANIIKAIPDVKLVIVGEGPLEQDLKALTQKLSLLDKVIFMKKRRDISAILKTFDIFVLPSLWEGLSVVLLEAMYMSKTVIATDIPSNKEAMINNETGVLVQEKNSVLLADAVIAALNNKALMERYGENAKKRVSECFSSQKRIAELEDLYSALIRKDLLLTQEYYYEKKIHCQRKRG